MIYDVCIVGGGINGVSTALQCADNKYSTILFEKNTLGCGASSKTSKLAHGGLRYLERLELSLVKECLVERNYLLDTYPELVTPMPFVFPIYKDQSALKMWAGLKIYDYLAKGTKMPRSRKLSIEETKLYIPWLDTTNIKCCFMYYDAVMKDKDIVITVANKARQLGAEIFSEEGVVKTTSTEDYVTVNTNKRSIRCKVLVNVTGAWNKEHASPSKGVHIITNKLKSTAATILINPDDGRAFFTIPYNNTTIIGTTDEPYSGDPDDVRVTMAEKQYVLKAINNFCIQDISSANIIGEYAGLRPLAKDVTKDGSRDTSIHSSGRIVSMVGGKFTTHRAMSEEVIKIVARTL